MTDNLPATSPFGNVIETDEKMNIISMAELLISSPPTQHKFFPTDFIKRKVQRCIIDFSHHRFKASPDGKVKDRYLDIQAYSLGVYYKQRIIPEDIQFILRLPWRTFQATTERDANVHLPMMLTEMQNKNIGPPFFEVHFVKIDKYVYQLRFFAFLSYKQNEDGTNVWSRERILYIESGYNAEDLNVRGDDYF